jgi:hypothetical protein
MGLQSQPRPSSAEHHGQHLVDLFADPFHPALAGGLEIVPPWPSRNDEVLIERSARRAAGQEFCGREIMTRFSERGANGNDALNAEKTFSVYRGFFCAIFPVNPLWQALGRRLPTTCFDLAIPRKKWVTFQKDEIPQEYES